jgi:aminopeptidase N
MRYSFLIFILSLLCSQLSAQHSFTRQDTLRGSITPERAWWDLAYYHLALEVDPYQKQISGSNTIEFTCLKPGQRLQIDLQPPMKMHEVTFRGKPVPFQQEGNAWFIELPEPLKTGQRASIEVFYSGSPKVAFMAPWDAAITWTNDRDGYPFVATSCQGEGASTWWPCKDHMYDEPDSMLISIRVPEPLMDISNGRLRKVEQHKDSTRTFHWFVNSPINNYGVNINVGNYTHFSEAYQGEAGQLDCDYYVLPYNLSKAQKQFQDVARMLDAFEHWFGPYPFYEDGFKLVEVPYLGMEHQSSVTYGNGYQNGYRGTDLSGTGWGLKFDFIIIHEAGHEWFANSITYKDIADMWIHEGFTAYSENLFLDYHYGKEASAAYVIGTRSNIQNDVPVIGPYGVNQSGSTDMYYKGANMLHTLRTLVNDDDKWRNILRKLNKKFYHQTVTSREIENFLSLHTGMELSAFFNQYLRTVKIPVLEYRKEGKSFFYRWSNVVDEFEMPVEVLLNGQSHQVTPRKGKWQKLKLDKPLREVEVDIDYYVEQRLLLE